MLFVDVCGAGDGTRVSRMRYTVYSATPPAADFLIFKRFFIIVFICMCDHIYPLVCVCARTLMQMPQLSGGGQNTVCGVGSLLPPCGSRD